MCQSLQSHVDVISAGRVLRKSNKKSEERESTGTGCRESIPKTIFQDTDAPVAMFTWIAMIC